MHVRSSFRLLILFFATAMCNLHCQNPNKPNVSSIDLKLDLKRFEADMFSIDTANIVPALAALQGKYQDFYGDFVTEILGLDVDSLQVDSSSHVLALKRFLVDYLPVKEEADKRFKQFSSEKKEIESALKYVKYYYPHYRVPETLITFVGPFDANFLTSFGIQGDILTHAGLGVGLQLHLGADNHFYETPALQALYPRFLVQNFDPEHISVNCMRNIVDDLYPQHSAGRPLIEQMVERGRKLYLISRFLPNKKEEIILGYTKKDYKAAKKNEGVVWSFFLSNDLLNTNEQDVIQNYIGEGPKTPELGEGAPGNLGGFAGFQIVKKFMEKFPETSLPQLMQTQPRKIYSLSKYKPAI